MRFYFLALGTLVVVCFGCNVDGQRLIDKGEYVAPPAALMQRPGPMVDLPYPAIFPPMGPPQNRAFQEQTTQVRFVGPIGMKIGWKIGQNYAENQLVSPARWQFAQGATFRLKLTSVSGREGLTLYPTLQIYPGHPTTDAYLSHNSIPIELTDEDIDQIESNNFVTKVIYLPDPKFQELAIAGVETLSSTRLDPGVDPVSEADRRGTIMVVLRVGNKNLEQETAGNPSAQADNGLQQISYNADGEKGELINPVPVEVNGTIYAGVPGPVIVGGSGGPNGPIAGMNGTPMWGMPNTATPIGLPGPPHLPYGAPAGLKSHTVRNLTKTELPDPVDHMLIDVKHEPGIRLPKPVRHVEYSENHPIYGPGQVSQPNWNLNR
ncbi:MAG: hypothetical protein ACKV2Q_32160 [Planctomycetaceae bacterium]